MRRKGLTERIPRRTRLDDIKVAELSLNSIVGLTSLRTMKMHGLIGPQEMVVLVDNGTTHNFIATDLVLKLGILLDKTKGYGVIMGTGLTVKGEGFAAGWCCQFNQLRWWRTLNRWN